jgi:anti-sigma factor (TIGR02949 family)
MEIPNRRSCDELEPLLTPYVDGEADEGERDTVERHIETCPACGRRIDAERTGRAVVQARREALRTPAPAALRARCRRLAQPRAARARRWVPLSLAASVLLALAGAFVYHLADPVEALAASVAADHLKCFGVQDTSVTADAGVLRRRWQRDHEWRLPVAPGRPENGIRLVGLRRCMSTRGSMAHLMYIVDGRPISVFVWREAGGLPATVEVLGQTAIFWSTSEHFFAVVGQQEGTELARMIDHVRATAE